MSVLAESEFLIYRWEDETLRFERRLFIKHQLGEPITKERLRQAVEDEVYDFKPAQYRAVPIDRYVDFTVQAQVILP